MIATLATVLLASLVLLVPGAIAALTWHPGAADDDEGPLHHVAFGLGWGFGLVPFAAFCLAIATGTALGAGTVVAASALVAAAFVGWWWLALGRRGVPEQLGAGWRRAAPVLAASAGVGLVYVLKYDSSLFFDASCINRMVLATLGLSDPPIDVLTSNEEDQRLGNTAVLSSFVALYGGLGFRLAYGLLGAAMALGGFLLGRRALGSRRWGWVVLVLLPLNPYVLGLPFLDENLLFLGFSCLWLPLLLRASVPWLSVGALFGLAVMMRHVAILGGLAFVWALWVAARPRSRAVLAAFVGFNAVTVVGHLHHALALGSVFRLENSGQWQPTPHRFIGDYPGLLQWPFADEVVRTPWNPLPVFAMWPTYLVDHLGVVLSAAALLGVVALWRTERREGAFWLAWFAPTYLALSVQENWDVPNKMGIVLILFAPVVLWAAAGLRQVARAPRRWGPALVVVTVGLALGVPALRALEVPADARYAERARGMRAEDPAYLALARQRVTEVALWPDYGLLGRHAEFWGPAKLRALGDALADPGPIPTSTPYGWFAHELAAGGGGPAAVVELDLSRRLVDRSPDWLRPVADGAGEAVAGGCGGAACPPGARGIDEDGDGSADVLELDLVAPGAPFLVEGGALAPWSAGPVALVTTSGGARLSGALLIFEPMGDGPELWSLLQREHSRAALKLIGLEPAAWAERSELRRVPALGARVRLRVAAGPLSLAESINVWAQRYVLWRGRVGAGEGASVLAGPWEMLHN